MYTHLSLTNRLTLTGIQAPEKGRNEVPPFRKCKLYHFEYDTSKTWLIEFYQWNVKTQKKQRRFFSRFNTIADVKGRLKEANRWIAFIDQQLEQGAVFNPDAATVQNNPGKVRLLKDDLTDYLGYQKRVLADTSISAYSGFVDKWTEFAKANNLLSLPTAQLTPALCQGFVDYLVTLSISNTTRNNQITRLHAFCSHYMKPGRERFEQNPARFLEMFTAKTESHEPFTPKQADTIIKYLTEQQDFQLLMFIYFIKYTFARPGKEVRLMKVRDLKESTLRITSTYSKSSRVKTPTIPKPLAELIERLQIRQYEPDYYVFGNEGTPGPVPCDKNHFYRRHRKVLDELNLTGAKYTLYGWKHTGNIKLFKATGKITTNQQQNGHASPRTTEIYLAKMGLIADDEIIEKFV